MMTTMLMPTTMLLLHPRRVAILALAICQPSHRQQRWCQRRQCCQLPRAGLSVVSL
jgi:hypothetical protein